MPQGKNDGQDIRRLFHVVGLLAVGTRNISLARYMLEEFHIPLVNADVGRENGRKIIFNSGSGQVLLRRHRGILQRTA